MRFLYFLFLLWLSNVVYGNVPTVSITEIETCEVKGKPIDMKLTLSEAEGKSVVSLTVDTDQEITEEFTYTAVVMKAVQGEYVHQVDLDGPLCKAITTYVEEAWTRARGATNPPIEEECFAPPGKYTLDDFYVAPDEVKMPEGAVGEFKVDLKVLNGSDDEVYCAVVKFKIDEL